MFKLVASGLVLLMIIAIAGSAIRSQLLAPLNLTTPQVIEIQNGDSLHSLARKLKDQGLIPIDSALFKYYGMATAKEGMIKAGEYELDVGMNTIDLLTLFRSGKVKQRQITFPEGLTFREWRRLLEQRSDIKQTIVNLSDRIIMEELGEPRRHPEGQFAPDTYHYVKSESDISILQRAYQQQQKLLETAWQGRTVGSELHSMNEALILASIVEKETGYEPDRGKVARVFLNRLAQGIRLQSDPTVIYGMGKSFTGDLTRKDLREDQPYNTYSIHGLPPTPICMPGLAAIQATLNAEPGNYVYFVAKGDGTSQFSTSLQEHNRAVQRFQRVERKNDYRSSPR